VNTRIAQLERASAGSTLRPRIHVPSKRRSVTWKLAVRIAQRILALTLGMLQDNRLAGRPARALAAYDGR
jgi:hypothetical protein